MKLQISCFCLKFYPLILATYFSIYQLFLWWFSSGDFLFPFCLLLQGLLGDLSIYLLISVCIHGYLFFGYDPFLGPTVSSLATGGPFRLFSVFFWNTPSIFCLCIFLSCGTTRCTRFFIFSYLRLKSDISLRAQVLVRNKI